MSYYENWKMVFAYASQKTVIDVACDVGVKLDEEISDPSYCGTPVQHCEHTNPCEELGDVDHIVK